MDHRVPRRAAALLLIGLLLVPTLVACGRDGGAPTVAPTSSGTSAPEPACDPPSRSTAPAESAVAAPDGSTAPTGLRPPPGPGRLTGAVTDGPCGRPVEGAAVYLYGGDNSFVIGTTKTDAAGRFEFPSVPVGSYRVGFVDPLGVYIASFFPDGADLGSAAPIAVTRDGRTIDAQLYTPETHPAPAYAESRANASRRIAVVGDSLVQQSTSVIRDKLDPLGSSSIRGISNQRIDELLPIATKLAATHPTDVVLAVGNNDVRQHVAIESSMAALAAMVDLFEGAECIVVLNLNTHTLDLEFNAAAVRFNEQLDAPLADKPRVHVVDWDSVVALLLEQGEAESTWFTDGLHLTDLGAGAFAATMHDGLARCERSS